MVEKVYFSYDKAVAFFMIKGPKYKSNFSEVTIVKGSSMFAE
jgi:hypothetical protein